jgi:serine/threonine-protein kinase
MIGTTISHYKILEKLGEGGMGVVYKAEDLKLERPVALKFLPGNFLASEQDKARFVQEAKSASALNHPNVATVYEIDEVDGQMFIAMEFVDGATLREKLSGISLKQAVDIGVQIADGLAAAHEKGIVHRDIKPENIMVRKDGICQIMDFGLAKLRGTKSKISRLTKEGSTIGTAGYMSPEQVQGQDVDHRSDIFSLGVVLYEMFTGQLPFKGVHETALLYEIVNVDPVPMSAVKPEIEASLDGIILECLAKEPSERYQSVAEVAKELRRFKRESTRARATRTMATRQFAQPTGQPAMNAAVDSAQPTRAGNRWLWPAISGVLAIAAVLFALTPWHKEAATTRPVMHLSIQFPPDAPLVGAGTGLALSPDGTFLAYLGGTISAAQLYLRRMDQSSSQVIRGTEGANEPSFSPDGQWIAFSAGGVLKKVSVFGGAPEEICNIQGLARGIWWGADNSILFGHISRGVSRVSPNGGTPEAVTTLDSAAGEVSHRFPQLLPDGKSVLFTIKNNNIVTFDEAVIAVQRIGSRDRKILIHGGSFARYLPTGHLSYLRGNILYAVPFDLDRLEVTGPPQPVVEGGWLNRGSGEAYLSFSNTGTLVFAPAGPFSYENISIASMDRTGALEPLLDTLRSYNSAILSPDGEKLALGINAANDDIWIYQIKRGTLTRLTFAGGNNDIPVWSPDGKYVIYQSEKGKSPNIFRKAWDGSGVEERLTQSPDAQLPFSCTPDGKAVIFGQNSDIWMLPLENDRKPVPLLQSSAHEFGGIVSPDGRWMAYSSDESGKFEINVVPFPARDGKWQISTGGGANPIWSRDGKELFYVNGTSLMAVKVSSQATFDYSVPKKLCDIPSTVQVFDVSSDAQKFVVLSTKSLQFTLPQVEVVVEWFQELKGKFASNKN